MATKPKLTIKQTKFVKAYVATNGNGRQSALMSYDTTSQDVANAIAVENLQKPSIKEAIEQALIKHEITMDAAVKPIADGLLATRTVGFGEDALETVDHSTRLKASGMALKLMGAEQKSDTPAGNIFINNANFNSKKYVEGE